MKSWVLLFSLIFSFGAMAAELDEEVGIDPEQPTAAAPLKKKDYPGGADEEDLQVQDRLPEAMAKTDSHSIQKDVYKALYNEEMKSQSPESPEE